MKSMVFLLVMFVLLHPIESKEKASQENQKFLKEMNKKNCPPWEGSGLAEMQKRQAMQPRQKDYQKVEKFSSDIGSGFVIYKESYQNNATQDVSISFHFSSDEDDLPPIDEDEAETKTKEPHLKKRS